MPRADADRSRSDHEGDETPPQSETLHPDDVALTSDVGSEDDPTDALVVLGLEIESEVIPIDTVLICRLTCIVLLLHTGLGSEAWNALAIHYVRPKPDDLAQCITPALTTFQGQRVLDKSIALIDIQLRTNMPRACTTDTNDPYTLREMWRLPSALTRAALLHFLGLKDLCQRIASPCVVQYGFHPWLQQDAQEMPILDGLFIRVQVPLQQVEFPLPFYVQYARAGIAFDRMLEHYRIEQRAISRRLANMFENDDAEFTRAVNDLAPELPAGEDTHALVQTTIPRRIVGSGNHELAIHGPANDVSLANPFLSEFDESSLMTPVSRATAMPLLKVPVQQILVIYELNSPPITLSIDPAVPISRYRHSIGILMEVDRNTEEWDNFQLVLVRTRPPHLDPLTHECYLFVMPQQMRRGQVHLVVRLQLHWEAAECDRTEEHSEIHVIMFPQ